MDQANPYGYAFGSMEPEHGALVTLDPLEFKMFHFNPAQLEAQLGANYNRQASIGASYQRLHFQNTSNVVFSLDLKSDIRFLVARKVRPGQKLTVAERKAVVDDFKDYERFLASLVYPVGAQSDIIRRSPPTVLLVWPGLIGMKVKVMTLRFRWGAFNQEGHPIEMTCSATFEELRNYRLTNSIARRKGFDRPEPANKVAG